MPRHWRSGWQRMCPNSAFCDQKRFPHSVQGEVASALDGSGGFFLILGFEAPARPRRWPWSRTGASFEPLPLPLCGSALLPGVVEWLLTAPDMGGGEGLWLSCLGKKPWGLGLSIGGGG